MSDFSAVSDRLVSLAGMSRVTAPGVTTYDPRLHLASTSNSSVHYSLVIKINMPSLKADPDSNPNPNLNQYIEC